MTSMDSNGPSGRRPPPSSTAESWHVERGVPIALIVTVALQFGVGIWVASQISAQVQVNQRDINRLQVLQERAQEVAVDQAIKLGQIDQSLRSMSDSLRRLASQTEDTAPR